MERGAGVLLHGVPMGIAASVVELLPYDSRWPALFESEAALLLSGLEGQIGRIVHIGSTAILGMDAKPIIDLMAEVPRLRAPSLLHWSLARFGYSLHPVDEIPDRLFFVKSTQGYPTHHLSVCESRSDFWAMHVAFRDRVRADPALADEYLALKRHLWRDYPNDRSAYTRGKAAFVDRVLNK